jgi:hypothetical protein
MIHADYFGGNQKSSKEVAIINNINFKQISRLGKVKDILLESKALKINNKYQKTK